MVIGLSKVSIRWSNVAMLFENELWAVLKFNALPIYIFVWLKDEEIVVLLSNPVSDHIKLVSTFLVMKNNGSISLLG